MATNGRGRFVAVGLPGGIVATYESELPVFRPERVERQALVAAALRRRHGNHRACGSFTGNGAEADEVWADPCRWISIRRCSKSSRGGVDVKDARPRRGSGTAEAEGPAAFAGGRRRWRAPGTAISTRARFEERWNAAESGDGRTFSERIRERARRVVGTIPRVEVRSGRCFRDSRRRRALVDPRRDARHIGRLRSVVGRLLRLRLLLGALLLHGEDFLRARALLRLLQPGVLDVDGGLFPLLVELQLSHKLPSPSRRRGGPSPPPRRTR